MMFSFKLVLFVVICVTFGIDANAAECRLKNYDFSPLDGSPWIVESVNGSQRSTYRISICKPLSVSQPAEAPCQHSTAVCRGDGGNGYMAIGNFTSPLNVTELPEKGELWLVMAGAPCPNNPGMTTKTIINFKCGKTLGSPRLLDTYACDTYFEWHTSVMCADGATAKEVKCHVYGSDGLKRDLSPLIKQKGAYLVDSAGDRDFYINVCREITPNGTSKSCPMGNAACEIVGGESRGQGTPVGQVSITADGRLYLLYRASSHQPGCDSPPTTAITFICPIRGGGREPLLTSDLGCHYDVEWVTEYACPERRLVSNTCTLTESQHDIEFDLNPLKKSPVAENPYKVRVKQGDRTYDYYLNVCSGLHIDCPDESSTGISACQVGDQNFAKVLGRFDHQTLRYSDGELTLTYQSGDKCSSHFLRETVINFHCDRSAPNDGHGWPEFNREDNCTYLFDWSTKYACLPHALPGQCHVKHAGHRYDLSTLTRNRLVNWEALRSTHIEGETDDDRYFINICHDVLKIGVAAGCPPAAAVCLRNKAGSYVSLGEYVDIPTYDPASRAVLLHYTNGSNCTTGNKRHESYIRLRCKLGDLETGPDLVRSSRDGCTHEFEWQTAAACSLSTQQGEDCHVTDEDAGYSIDLRRLRKSGAQAYYKLTTPDKKYDYFINVCGATTGTPCNLGEKKDTAICQVSKSQPTHGISAGMASQALSYYNGLVNLTYTDGDFYRSTPPHPRSSQIAFLCQPDAGSGAPEFIHEANYTYAFRWRTAYVCPETPIECVVTDPKSGRQYDISSLAKSSDQGNWVTYEAGAAKRQKFYLNVCRPVNMLSPGIRCAPHAAACSTQSNDTQGEVVGVASLGKAESGPTIEGDGQLLLTYKNGDPCTKLDGTKTNCTTKIHLRCQRGQLNGHPRPMATSEECMYVFLWETAAACALGGGTTPTAHTPSPGGSAPDGTAAPSGSNSTGNMDCAVKDPNSEFVFDLKILRKNPEEVDYTVGDYMVNVCGAVSVAGCNAVDGRPAAVCEGTQHVAGFSTHLSISDNGRLSLTYQGIHKDDGQRDVVLLFECDATTIRGPLRVSQSDAETLQFTMRTALACAPEPVDCMTADDEGHEYDLTPLSRTVGNWRVVDTRADHRDLTYYINVCHTLNVVTGASCPGGAIGGCQVDRDGTSHNLGYVQSRPIAGQGGALSIRYLGGSVCHKGTPLESRRSTRIIFECSDTQHTPVLQSETPNCEYVFTWKTPSACPLKTVMGTECRVTEPLYHYTFDLSPLQKMGDHDYSVTAGEYTYLLNVCGQLNSAHDCGAGTGACQTKPKAGGGITSINTGKANQKLRYNDGELTVTYTDGKGPCHKKFTRTTLISFVCDHTTFGSRGPTFINESSDCTYMFEWRTSLACMSFQLADCTIKDNVRHYQFDLSPLTLTRDNYIYSRDDRRYLINVCTTLVHKKGATCPLNSAACYIDSSETDPTKKYVKLGEPTGRLLSIDDHGNIRLTYKHGQNCSTAVPQQHQTIITFVCKRDAIATSPTFLYAEDDCVFQFVWKTRVACPITDPTPPLNNCTVKNPVTGYIYNMVGLSRSAGYVTHDGHGHEMRINICGPLSGSPCADNPGACQSEITGTNGPWNAGLANGKLHFIDGDIFLNYSGGAVCHHNNLTRNTIINFVCAKNGTGQGVPVYVDEDEDCNYFLSWHTELACERQVRCEVEYEMGHVLDLSPLVRGSGSHLALIADVKDQKVTYYINVCRPLNPISGVLCPPQAAACMVKDGESPKSLGRVTAVPFFDQYSRNVITVYDHGTPCEKNSGQTNSSSRISFVCKPGPSLGQPLLEMVTSDCQYLFEWETNVVCMTGSHPVVTTDCHFTDMRMQHTYDLSPLTKSSQATTGYSVNSKKGTFYINVCAGVVDVPARAAGCGGAAVCLVDTQGHGESFGMPTTEQYTMESDALKVSYTGGKICGSGKAASFFLFECNTEIQGLGQPEIFSMSTDGCEVVFKWQTPLACKPVVKDCSLAHEGAVYDLQLLSRDTGSWNVTDGYGNRFWLNLCQGLHGSVRSPDCPPNAAACRRDAHGQVDTLGLVQTQHVSMAADGKTIVLEYSEGSKTCAQRRRRRDDDRASVIIKLQCGDMVGEPVFIHRKGDKDSCAFEFTWKSQAACKEKRVAVAEVDGLLIDPRSGGTIDLSRLKHPTDYHVTTTDGRYEFYINIHGSVARAATVASCKDAAVCQKVAGAAFGINLGNFSTRTFYMEDDVVEAEFTSSTSCQSDSSHKASTVIVFHCMNTFPNNTGPVFRGRSRSCAYLFDWYTPHICVQPMIGGKSSHAGPSAARGAGTPVITQSTAGAIVGSSIALIILIGLVVIFSKPERRQTFRRGIRRVFQRRHGGSLIKYSTLSSLDEDEFLIPNNSVNATATLSDLNAHLPTFGDDSDEDLIL